MQDRPQQDAGLDPPVLALCASGGHLCQCSLIYFSPLPLLPPGCVSEDEEGMASSPTGIPIPCRRNGILLSVLLSWRQIHCMLEEFLSLKKGGGGCKEEGVC